MSRIKHLAFAMEQFRLFRIPHPRLLDIGDELATLRELGMQSRDQWVAKGSRGQRMPQKFLPIIGPSGSGKSTAIKHYIETVLAKETHDDETRPVVHVTLSAKATTRQLGSDILQEYGDPEADVGSAMRLLARASNTIEMARTDVLVLDEIHHLHNLEGNTTAWSVTETIKRMLIRGACPFILIGTEQAKPLLLQNRQFVNRSLPPIFLDPLNINDPKEWKTFKEHCGGFDVKLVEHKVFEKLSGLMGGDVPACVYDVCKGVIGEASNIFETAAAVAIKRDGDRIVLDDLEKAVDIWARALDVTDRNPFRDGLPKLSTKKAA